MVKINLKDTEIIDKVYDKIRRGIYPLNERNTAFLLGYHLSDKESKLAFEIGWTGPVETSFSPDLDVLRLQKHPTGYELKGLRGEASHISKDQFYKGIGQATALLNQPLRVEGSLIKYSYLTIPRREKHRTEDFVDIALSVEQTPIGLIEVDEDGYSIWKEAEQNDLYDPSIRQQVVKHLKNQATGTDIRHPDSGLVSLALEIIEKENDKKTLL